jgi:hypothetical protein
MGDVNAKIGVTKLESHARSAAGIFGMDERNPRGERLLQFAIDNNLTVSNTQFSKSQRNLYSCSNPGDRQRNTSVSQKLSELWLYNLF